MGDRRKSRELILQALFSVDANDGRTKLEDSVRLFCLNYKDELNDNVRPFFELILEGIINNLSGIDELISKGSNNWKLSRMSGVDRNVMRIAVFEMLYCDDIPEKVSINEAIDIGKKYGTRDSGSFINGVLDSIHLELQQQS